MHIQTTNLGLWKPELLTENINPDYMFRVNIDTIESWATGIIDTIGDTALETDAQTLTGAITELHRSLSKGDTAPSNPKDGYLWIDTSV